MWQKICDKNACSKDAYGKNAKDRHGQVTVINIRQGMQLEHRFHLVPHRLGEMKPREETWRAQWGGKPSTFHASES